MSRVTSALTLSQVFIDLCSGHFSLRLLSEDFKENEAIPSRFTCDGEDICPQLHWEDAPERARSYALSMTDPDSPGGTFIHWLIHDISKEARSIERGGLPNGAKQLKNDFGMERYGGPCPRSGTHRYYFTLYALGVDHLGDINRRDFFKLVDEHTLDKAELMGTYRRK
jgi:Raf kinase inhibitor-like YbhB/YbcL family protein